MIMDWQNILAMALGGGGVLSGLFGWLSSRKTTNAQANVTSADYADKIITQADKRVEQYQTDAETWRAETAKWQEEGKIQRKAKQEWRTKHEEAIARIHELELAIKDKETTIVRLEFDKCLIPHCKARRPPRREPENLNVV
jgi:hypothetical protein